VTEHVRAEIVDAGRNLETVEELADRVAGEGVSFGVARAILEEL
jgi:hypothetical protein